MFILNNLPIECEFNGEKGIIIEYGKYIRDIISIDGEPLNLYSIYCIIKIDNRMIETDIDYVKIL